MRMRFKSTPPLGARAAPVTLVPPPRAITGTSAW